MTMHTVDDGLEHAQVYQPEDILSSLHDWVVLRRYEDFELFQSNIKQVQGNLGLLRKSYSGPKTLQNGNLDYRVIIHGI